LEFFQKLEERKIC